MLGTAKKNGDYLENSPIRGCRVSWFRGLGVRGFSFVWGCFVEGLPDRTIGFTVLRDS